MKRMHISRHWQHILLALKFTTQFCFSHQFKQADLSEHPLDTGFVARKAMTQTKLNICLISFYMGGCVRFWWKWGSSRDTEIAQHFLWDKTKLLLSMLRGTPAACSRENLLSKNLRSALLRNITICLLFSCTYGTNTKREDLRQLFSSLLSSWRKYLFRENRIEMPVIHSHIIFGVLVVKRYQKQWRASCTSRKWLREYA